MKRYLLTILMSLAMAFAIATMMGRTAYADLGYTTGGIKYELSFSNHTASVTGYSENLGDVAGILKAVEFGQYIYPVTSIDENAFQGAAIEIAIIPNGVISKGAAHA